MCHRINAYLTQVSVACEVGYFVGCGYFDSGLSFRANSASHADSCTPAQTRHMCTALRRHPNYRLNATTLPLSLTRTLPPTRMGHMLRSGMPV